MTKPPKYRRLTVVHLGARPKLLHCSSEDNGMGIRDSNEHIGVVAQEVQRVIPEAVTQNGKGYLPVNNDPVIWAMVDAIKEQGREIEQQRKLLRAQNAQMQNLAAEVRRTREVLRQVKAQAVTGQLTMMASR